MKKFITIKERMFFKNNGAGFGPLIGSEIVLTPAQYKNKALREAFQSGGRKVVEDGK
jgi:hypothetical protein